jgi:two-component system nitrogen regulation response regulator GlnG
MGGDLGWQPAGAAAPATAVLAAAPAMADAGSQALPPAVAPVQPPAGVSAPVAAWPAEAVPAGGWLLDLKREARRLLEAGNPEVWDTLTRQFEGQLIHAALEITRGRRIEAAHKLGIGRNTITRKIQELGLDD